MRMDCENSEKLFRFAQQQQICMEKRRKIIKSRKEKQSQTQKERSGSAKLIPLRNEVVVGRKVLVDRLRLRLAQPEGEIHI